MYMYTKRCRGPTNERTVPLYGVVVCNTTHVPGSTELLIDYHHNIIIKVERSLVCVKSRRRISRSGLTQDIKWVAVYSRVTFHINEYHNDRSAPCLYTVTGRGVMSCVCGMAFLCGSTLAKVPLLQAGTVAIWPQMFKTDVKQTNKQIFLDKGL